jgi:hypothetical protein
MGIAMLAALEHVYELFMKTALFVVVVGTPAVIIYVAVDLIKNRRRKS